MARTDDKGRLVAQPHPARLEEANPVHSSNEWLEDYRRHAALLSCDVLTDD